MRILHVVAYYPPDRVGGVGQVVSHLHRALRAAGHTSHVLTAGTTRDDPTVERIARSPLGFVTGLTRCAARARSYDLVHCHHGDALGMLIGMKLLRISTPVLATVHSGHRAMGEAHRPYRLAGRRFGTGWNGWKYRRFVSTVHRAMLWSTLRLVDHASFIARDPALRTLGATQGARARVIYNGLPELPEAATEPPPDPSELLYVGSGGHLKRVLALPFVLAQVRRSIPDARLRVVGVEFERERDLTGLIDELGLRGAVRFEGRVPPESVQRFYRASQLLIVPSAYEGLPMVILEALQAGLPCVATRVGAVGEVIDDGSNGFLVDPDDPSQMAERCVRILQDEDLRRAMGDAGRASVRDRFDLGRQLSETLDLYRELCGSTRVVDSD